VYLYFKYSILLQDCLFKSNKLATRQLLIYSYAFHLLLKIPAGELEVLVVEQVVDQTEDDVGV